MTNLLWRRLALAGLGAMLIGPSLAQTAPGGATDPVAPGASMPAPAATMPMPASAAPMSMPPAAIAPAADPTPQATSAVPPVAAAKPVTTLARVVSVHSEPASEMNVRLKLVPRMSYATQTFKVTDRSQLEGLSEGSWVRFTSKRQDGVEMLDKVEPVVECKRMAVCGSTRSLPAPSTSS